MTIAEVEVSDGAAAKLVCLLLDHGEDALALHLCHAIDHLHDQFVLTRRDREAVRRVLADCPPELADLRACIIADDSAELAADCA